MRVVSQRCRNALKLYRWRTTCVEMARIFTEDVVRYGPLIRDPSVRLAAFDVLERFDSAIQSLMEFVDLLDSDLDAIEQKEKGEKIRC
jgi:hypothetical protein